jgi:hypothetical protein
MTWVQTIRCTAKKNLRFFLADAENWRDLKTQKKFKILFEGARWLMQKIGGI